MIDMSKDELILATIGAMTLLAAQSRSTPEYFNLAQVEEVKRLLQALPMPSTLGAPASDALIGAIRKMHAAALAS